MIRPPASVIAADVLACTPTRSLATIVAETARDIVHQAQGYLPEELARVPLRELHFLVSAEHYGVIDRLVAFQNVCAAAPEQSLLDALERAAVTRPAEGVKATVRVPDSFLARATAYGTALASSLGDSVRAAIPMPRTAASVVGALAALAFTPTAYVQAAPEVRLAPVVVELSVEERAEHEVAALGSRFSHFPIKDGVLTSAYGVRDLPAGVRGSRVHMANDFAPLARDWKRLPDVFAAANGVVAAIEKEDGQTTVTFAYAQGEYSYTHIEPSVVVGDSVRAGEIVGRVVDAGSAPHLHFMDYVRVGNELFVTDGLCGFPELLQRQTVKYLADAVHGWREPSNFKLDRQAVNIDGKTRLLHTAEQQVTEPCALTTRRLANARLGYASLPPRDAVVLTDE